MAWPKGCAILQEPEKSLHHPEVLWAFWATFTTLGLAVLAR